MTKKEMILLESCIRLALLGVIDKNDEVTGELSGIIHNVSMGVFYNKVPLDIFDEIPTDKADAELKKIKNLEKEVKANLHDNLIKLLKKVNKCDKAFNGYMII